jgi:valyl-tRNA synthetase
MANLPDKLDPKTEFKLDPEGGKLEDKSILSRLNRTISEVTGLMEHYRFNSAVKCLYDFIWHDFCDWYVEMIKQRLNLPEGTEDKVVAQNVAHLVLNQMLRLLHPFAPFVTEEIWHHLYGGLKSDGHSPVSTEKWPQCRRELIDDDLEEALWRVQEVVTSIRNIRSEMNVPPAKRADVLVKVDTKDLQAILEKNQDHVRSLGRVERLEIGMKVAKPDHAASAVIKDAEIFVPLEGLIDLEQERIRLEKEIARVAKLLEKTDKKLSNEDFLKRAPREIIDKEKARGEEYRSMLKKLNKNLEGIVGW